MVFPFHYQSQNIAAASLGKGNQLDDPVPSSIYDVWLQWHSELHLLSEKHIPRCYFDRESHVITTKLHGFCDASELAYAAVVYLRLTTTIGTQVSLVIAKTKVSPIKRLTIHSQP